MEQGWVYVLINPTLPGLVKVGRTSRLPSTRVTELSQATGVATPFILVFEQAFADSISAERDIHAALDRCGMRVSPNREFFRGSTTEIVRVVLQYARDRGDGGDLPPPQSGLDLLQLGDAHLLGRGGTNTDLAGAFRCYQLAASRGSVMAFERLGVITAQLYGGTWSGRKRAAQYLKDGARRGNYYCYCEIAAMAAEEHNIANFAKAWDQFFLHRQSAWFAEAEDGSERYVCALRRYVLTCFALGLRPSHLPELRAEAAALVDVLTKSLDGEVQPASAQRMLIAALRWARQVLTQMPSARGPSLLIHGLLGRSGARWQDALA